MGEIAIVTGASEGLGAAIATVLAREGVTVILVARRLQLLEQVASKIKEKGGRALVKVADVTCKEQVKSMGRWVREEVGLPTILVNNAGTGKQAEFATLQPEDWEPVIDLNIKAGLLCIGEFLAEMKEAKKGHIVNITSIFERSTKAGASVYAGTKHFWGAMSDGLRKELVGSGVKVTNILPGMCNTQLVNKEMEEEVRSRLIQPEDVGIIVWETVNKPARCYVKDICMLDMVFFQSGEFGAPPEG